MARRSGSLEIGLWLASEEHPPRTLVRMAQRAEELGFGYVQISDHFHPWIDRQGQSPFVWSVIGGIGATTERIRVGTGVTCPTIRMHPAVVAHAAATSAAMLEGRFFLGVGSGENLNEHVVGRGWPEIDTRNEMLVEAIEAIRLLLGGGYQTYRGRYHTVEDARIYTLPKRPPPIYMAAGGAKAARTAAEMADGLVATAPDPEVIDAFERAGGADKPRYAEMRVCWSGSDADAKRLVHELWPTSALPGQVKLDIRLPRDFEQAATLVRPEASTEHVPTGPDPEPYVEALRKYADAGFDHVALHQVGPDQEGFFGFWRSKLRSALEREIGTRVAA